MKNQRFSAILVIALVAIVLASSLSQLTHAQQSTAAFADPAFQQLWQRTDQLVATGAVKRSYYWGPQPISGAVYEDYAEGKAGRHLVQYFDKSRMEINNLDGDRRSLFYVTNGLLTIELITGRMQTGNSKFVERYPAPINLASDPDDPTAPTYASFRTLTNRPSTGEYGGVVNRSINRAGEIRTDSRYATYNIKQQYFEEAVAHNIPDVFWAFLNQSGPVMVGGQQANARLNEPYFYATGYPISEAYWATVKIAGQNNTDVLIQPFERRVLTYVPSEAEGFKVQMGNIGQHYYDWRYNNAGAPTTPTPTVAGPTPTVGPLTCRQLPRRGFGKLWSENQTVKQQVGCPYGDEEIVAFAQQPFERGQMIDTIYIRTDREGRKTYSGSIYVLFNDGSVERYDDKFVGRGEPEPQFNPPAGKLAPRGGFAKAWRDETAAKLAERIGWATGTLYEANADGSSGAVQGFDYGQMIYSGPSKKIYVLYRTDRNRYSESPLKWGIYDDTFNG